MKKVFISGLLASMTFVSFFAHSVEGDPCDPTSSNFAYCADGPDPGTSEYYSCRAKGGCNY